MVTNFDSNLIHRTALSDDGQKLCPENCNGTDDYLDRIKKKKCLQLFREDKQILTCQNIKDPLASAAPSVQQHCQSKRLKVWTPMFISEQLSECWGLENLRWWHLGRGTAEVCVSVCVCCMLEDPFSLDRLLNHPSLFLSCPWKRLLSNSAPQTCHRDSCSAPVFSAGGGGGVWEISRTSLDAAGAGGGQEPLRDHIAVFIVAIFVVLIMLPHKHKAEVHGGLSKAARKCKNHLMRTCYNT